MTPPDNSEPRAATGADTPPWQRVAKDSGNGVPEAEPEEQTRVDGYGDRWSAGQLPTEGAAGYPGQGDPEATTRVEQPVVTGTAANRLFGGAPPTGRDESTQRPGAGLKGRATPSALRRPGRGPRRANLQIKRFDPWSVLKLSLVLGVALFFIWLVAVGVLYTVLDGMGVWDKLNGTYTSLVQGEGPEATGDPLISVGRVFSIAAVVGAINIVLISALATVSAFIYNVSADLAGGLEVTLSERE
ncbi:Transmembrane protein of unknown function [Amycolatopsis arida]|uniref:DUF3566 domain-containing protein n=1 Tax=Amycolatopsis arida TaxID=587909 RepID=A0A1I5TT98_9PSEU|nr:DUF3566 domain-containing protein [Amycolatopsis arida]TDX95976.1 transmembrane protein DUF3566 [Amycolatopsis arida]SFP86295.1 Transmembrane protein of unknown function [Amycolatopsis arida]